MTGIVDESASSPAPLCPICCTPIAAGDASIRCPHCKMLYHMECWQDNLGCATYGCPATGCLAQPTTINVPQAPKNLDTPRGADAFHPIDEAIRCPSCGTELRRGASFCWSCGAKLYERTGVGSVYQLSGKLKPTRLIIGILLGIPVVLLLSYIGFSFCYFYFFIGFPCGYLSHYIFKYTLTRNKGWGLGISIIMACFLLYFFWMINKNFGMFTETPSAILLGLAEVGVTVAVTLITVAKLNASVGFCEKCRSWTKESFTLTGLCPIVDLSLIQQDLRDGRTDALLALSRVGTHRHHTTLFVQSCSCGDLNLLSINDVTVTHSINDVTVTKKLLSNVIISEKMAHSLFVRLASSKEKLKKGRAS